MTIAFDLDGTLITCKNRQIEVLRTIIHSKNVSSPFYRTFDYHSWWNLKLNGKNTFDSLIQLGVSAKDADRINSFWKSKIENIEFLYLDMLYESVEETLNYLKTKNHKLLIITGRSNKMNVPFEIKRLGLQNFFDEIYCVNPNKVVVEKSILLKKEKADMFIGDTETDLLAAQDAKIPFIAHTNGQRSFLFLQQKGVKTHFTHFNQLYKFIQ